MTGEEVPDVQSLQEQKEEENKPLESTSDDKSSDQQFDESKYELVDGCYHYTDETTNIRYKFDNESQSWVEAFTDSKESEDKVTVDEEGRTFYHADGKYLCRDTSGNVYFLNEKNEWIDWNSQQTDVCLLYTSDAADE